MLEKLSKTAAPCPRPAEGIERLPSARRRFLAGASGLLATGLGGLLAPAPALAAQRRRVWIDGSSGLALPYLGADDPAVATELQAARDSGLSAVVLTLAPSGRFWLDDQALNTTQAAIDNWDAIVARHPQHLLQVLQAKDLERARRSKRLGVVYGFQGTEPLGEDLDRITLFRERGVRLIQLTHNRRNLVGDGCMEPGNAGLSNFGHAVVRQLNQQRLLVDLSHGSPRTIAEGIAASAAPVLISHSGCRALADHPRNVDDATLKALAARGGVIGIIFWPYLRTDAQPLAQDVIAHVEHALQLCGEDHVSIGTDTGVAPIQRTPEFETSNREWVADAVQQGIFQSGRPADLYTFIPDLNRVDRFARLAHLLSRRGHRSGFIDKLLGGNLARVMGEVWG